VVPRALGVTRRAGPWLGKSASASNGSARPEREARRGATWRAGKRRPANGRKSPPSRSGALIILALACTGTPPSDDDRTAGTDSTAGGSADPRHTVVADTQHVTDSLGNDLMIVTERQAGSATREVRPRKGSGAAADTDAIPLLTPREARSAMASARVPWYVLDVRSGPEYVARGHLPSTTLVPIDRLEENLSDLHVRVGQPVLVVSEGDLDARRAAALLARYGFPDVRVLRGGLEAWRDAGFPLESR